MGPFSLRAAMAIRSGSIGKDRASYRILLIAISLPILPNKYQPEFSNRYIARHPPEDAIGKAIPYQKMVGIAQIT
jgi:hypothetical protein